MNSQALGIISEKDRDSRIVRCNKVFLEYAHVKSRDKILGYTDYDFPWQEYADTYRAHELDALAGKNYSTLSPLKDGNGDIRFFLHNKAGKKDATGNIIGILCHAVEIFNPVLQKALFDLHENSPTENTTLLLGKKFDNVELTKREEEVLFFLVRNMTSKKIGQILKISPRTVESHLEHIKQKTSCKTKYELIDFCHKTGLAQILIGKQPLKMLTSHIKK